MSGHDRPKLRCKYRDYDVTKIESREAITLIRPPVGRRISIKLINAGSITGITGEPIIEVTLIVFCL
jgi:hypothetical protein